MLVQERTARPCNTINKIIIQSNFRISRLKASFKRQRMPGYLLPLTGTMKNSTHFLSSQRRGLRYSYLLVAESTPWVAVVKLAISMNLFVAAKAKAPSRSMFCFGLFQMQRYFWIPAAAYVEPGQRVLQAQIINTECLLILSLEKAFAGHLKLHNPFMNISERSGKGMRPPGKVNPTDLWNIPDLPGDWAIMPVGRGRGSLFWCLWIEGNPIKVARRGTFSPSGHSWSPNHCFSITCVLSLKVTLFFV